MNIKKLTQSLSIITVLFTVFVLAPSAAIAGKHHGNDSRHYSKHQQQSHTKSHSRHYNKHKHNKHRHGRKHFSKHRQNHHVVRSYYPSHNHRHWDNSYFSFGYQNDHFGFTFRD